MMNVTEEWIRWCPNNILLSPRYSIHAVIHDLDNFRVLLADTSDKTKKVWMIFDKSIDIFRCTDESYRLKTIHMLNKKYGSDFYAQWSFFKVTNSAYFEWLFDQSFETFTKEDFIHFVIIDSNSMLEIVVDYEPRFEFVTPS